MTVDQGGTVVQRDDYYPFGLTFNHWNSTIPENQYKFNGVELDVSTQTYETFFRGYDAALGRFNQIDPLTEIIPDISSYHFGFNNPITFNDPLGLMGNDPNKKKKRRKSSRSRNPEKDSDKPKPAPKPSPKPKPTPKPKPNSGSGVTPMIDKVKIVQEVDPDVIRGDDFEITILRWDPKYKRFKEGLGGWYNGVTLELGVKLNDLDDYDYLNWVQTVYSNTGKAGMGIGAYEDGLAPPLYFRRNLANDWPMNGFKPVFEDSPNRISNGDFTFWRAELSLIGRRNGKIERIFTLLWGFNLEDSKTTKQIKPYLWEPSRSHKKQINSVKIK